MGKFSTIAILSDLDGTFLSSSSGVVARNVEAIEYFKANGGRFSLATGRMHYNLDRLIPGVASLVNAPTIFCNGTYLYDFASERILTERFMEPEVSLSAALMIQKRFPEVYVRVSRREGYLLFEGDTRAERELQSYGISAYESRPLSAWDGYRWYKIVLSGAAETVNEVEEVLKIAFPDAFEYNRSRATTLELQMKGITKASLLGFLRRHFDELGEPRRIYACGDYENDRAILSAADMAVCPSGALPEIKDICDLCLGSNDDGVIADLVAYLDGKTDENVPREKRECL